MESLGLSSRYIEKIKELKEKGVKIPNPYTVDIGEDVEPSQISGEGVTIYPGSRIYGKKTVISRNSKIGSEGPATVIDCQIGPQVELKSGFFTNSVFLKGSIAGYGSHVRECCILEEEARLAHCCGIKHTILFPFVTLGSLINFCDCLLAGGTSRKDHSEVGSSYIHFNYTPYGDKATCSLFGDVPRGVMLREPPIFLGGQGGAVGPIRIGFGNVVAAGSILRGDYPYENKLIIGKTPEAKVLDLKRMWHRDTKRVFSNNIYYVSNLKALKEWYKYVRSIFFEGEEFGSQILYGALEKIDLAVRERILRLKELIERSVEKRVETSLLKDAIPRIEEIFSEEKGEDFLRELREKFQGILVKRKEEGLDYIDAIRSLKEDERMLGTSWLYSVIDHYLLDVKRLVDFIDLPLQKPFSGGREDG